MSDHADLSQRKFCSKCSGRFDGFNNLRNGKLYKTCNRCSGRTKKRNIGQMRRDDEEALAPTGTTMRALYPHYGTKDTSACVQSMKRKRSIDITIDLDLMPRRGLALSANNTATAFAVTQPGVTTPFHHQDWTSPTSTAPDPISAGSCSSSDAKRNVLDRLSTDWTSPSTTSLAAIADAATEGSLVKDLSSIHPPNGIQDAPPWFQTKDEIEDVANVTRLSVDDLPVGITSHEDVPVTIFKAQPSEPVADQGLSTNEANSSRAMEDFMSDAMDRISWTMQRFSLQSTSIRSLKSSKRSLWSSSRSFMSDWSAPMPAPMCTEMDDDLLNARGRSNGKRAVPTWQLSRSLKALGRTREDMFRCAISGDVPKLREALNTGRCSVNDPLSERLQHRYPGVLSLFELAVMLEKFAVAKFLVNDGEISQESLARVRQQAVPRLMDYITNCKDAHFKDLLDISNLDDESAAPMYFEAIKNARPAMVSALVIHRPPSSAASKHLRDMFLEQTSNRATSAASFRLDKLVLINHMMLWERNMLLELKAAIAASREEDVKALLCDSNFTLTPITEAILYSIDIGKHGPILGMLLLRLPAMLPGFSAEAFLKTQRQQCIGPDAIELRVAEYLLVVEKWSLTGHTYGTAREELVLDLTATTTLRLLPLLNEQVLKLPVYHEHAVRCLRMASHQCVLQIREK